jgi:alkaline phosphatase
VGQMVQSGAQVMFGFGKPETAAKPLAAMRQMGYQVVETRSDLLQAKEQKIVGVFDSDNESVQPSVAEMTQAAIERLSTNPKGFFLIVEHAWMDWEPGDTTAIIQDVKRLDDAVGVALGYARRQRRTLVLVTGDHETGGLKIRQPAKIKVLKNATLSIDDMVKRLDEKRDNVAEVVSVGAGISDLSADEIARIRETKDAGAAISEVLSARAGITWTSNGSHTATPVRIFAFGPGAKGFAGKIDNTDIPRKIAAVLGFQGFAVKDKTVTLAPPRMFRTAYAVSR